LWGLRGKGRAKSCPEIRQIYTNNVSSKLIGTNKTQSYHYYDYMSKMNARHGF